MLEVWLSTSTASHSEFTQLIDNNIVPMLRTQKCFEDEIAVVAPGGADASGISLWDLKENAEICERVPQQYQ